MIKLQNIQFGYVKNRYIFEDVSLTMEPGHIYGLLGKNGAGKTTLLKIMSGLRFPQSGAAIILGEQAALRKSDVLQNLYFLQEEMYVPHLTIRHFEEAYAPFYPTFNHRQFADFLHEFEIDHLDDYMDKFSHGQKKKVLIAFALASNTKILMMDEPTNGLDIPSKSTFRRIMASATTEERMVVISTHQVRDLHSLIDMITILDEGRIVINTSTAKINDKLMFKAAVEGQNADEIIYTEDTPRGIMVVKENKGHEDSNLDLELLFNATMASKERMGELFN